ncbi:ABC transporter permease [Nocardia sp. CDC153]|uniref:ABC transporter permease n=1 Tax=Nocardia sp. CDC153 TaxID=3112167 RepID=UPI002DB8B3D7|nr:ABC transporter permease [Nocardia sp. CDC153]MEC3958036.1 ABC transporter permease [Nocardia sp. CDC153]
MSTTTVKNALTDSSMLVRRSLKHIVRYPSMTIPLLLGPIIFLLLFVYVFGGTLGAGLGNSGGRGEYVNYVTPAILLLAVAGAATATAVAVCTDMTQGIVARFRTMSIFRPALLAGHVVGSMVQTFLCVAVVLGVAGLVGFRPHAGVLGWVGAAGMLALLTLAITWIAVLMGLVSDNVETASNLPMLLMILPFFGSGFVPTDSMPAWLAWIARNQPFSPVMETLRGLLLGTPVGHQAWIAVAWCVGIAAAAFWGATALLNREPGR